MKTEHKSAPCLIDLDAIAFGMRDAASQIAYALLAVRRADSTAAQRQLVAAQRAIVAAGRDLPARGEAKS